jgi:hypothetical protein
LLGRVIIEIDDHEERERLPAGQNARRKHEIDGRVRDEIVDRRQKLVTVIEVAIAVRIQRHRTGAETLDGARRLRGQSQSRPRAVLHERRPRQFAVEYNGALTAVDNLHNLPPRRLPDTALAQVKIHGFDRDSRSRSFETVVDREGDLDGVSPNTGGTVNSNGLAFWPLISESGGPESCCQKYVRLVPRNVKLPEPSRTTGAFSATIRSPPASAKICEDETVISPESSAGRMDASALMSVIAL